MQNKNEYKSIIPKRYKKQQSFFSTPWLTISIAAFVLIILFFSIKSNLFLTVFNPQKKLILQKQKPTHTKSQSIVYGNFMLAERFFKDKDYENAIKYYESVLSAGKTKYSEDATVRIAESYKILRKKTQSTKSK